MKSYHFRLRISSEEYLDYYRGAIRHVLVRSASGETVQFPASLLQRYVTPEGIHGDFTLTCDDDNSGAALQRTG